MKQIHFKTAVRNLVKNPTTSTINLLGLSVGLSVAIMVGLWAWDELSFNFVHPKHDRLAQVMDTETINGNKTTNDLIAIPVAQELRRNFGNDIEQVAVVFPNFTHTVSAGEKKLSGSGQWVQADFPSMISLKMIKGEQNALKDPSSVMIAESLANALYGSTDPIGQMLRLDNMRELKVGGVYMDLPVNSSFADTKLFLSWEKALTVMSWLKEASTQWDNRIQRIYVLLRGGVNINDVDRRIKSIMAQHVSSRKEELSLFPMNRWHLFGEFENGISTKGAIQYVRLFTAIGIFVLSLACINFVNMATARSGKRAKEVGIRKTLGSSRRQLISLFLNETVLLSVIASLAAILLTFLFLPSFNAMAGKNLALPLNNLFFFPTIVGFGLLVGLISGSYPAFFLSAFDPIKAIKGKFLSSGSQSISRKTLVVLQFTVSISLIIATLVIWRQVEFAKARPIGYSRAGLVSVTLNTPEIYAASYNSLRNDLLATGLVANMAKSSTQSTESPANNTDVQWKGKDPAIAPVWGQVAVTHDFGETMHWEILKGRDFSRAFQTDTGSIVLNEAAAHITNLLNPVGESVTWDAQPHKIIGVVKDMIMESPYQPVKPTLFILGRASDFYNAITIRVKPSASMHEALVRIEDVFKKYNPNGSFDFKFLDAEYGLKFSLEERIGKLVSFASILAGFISCLGLFGLASFTAEQRTREIGIRKVLGASVTSIWSMISKGFITLILIAFVIAGPLTYYLIEGWLRNYEYRTNVPWWLFAISALGSMLVALITISSHIVRAALANPVDSLKTE